MCEIRVFGTRSGPCRHMPANGCPSVGNVGTVGISGVCRHVGVLEVGNVGNSGAVLLEAWEVQHCVLPWRDAPRERIYHKLRSSAPEGPDIACCLCEKHTVKICLVIPCFRTECTGTTSYLDEKHPVDVYIVICVVPQGEAWHCFSTSARITPCIYVSLLVWCPRGRARQCVLPRREAPNERMYR